MSRKIFFDYWEDSGIDGIKSDFSITEDQLEGTNIIYAIYSYEDYEGSAIVLFERDGKLYEVNGGHCSCYGLEGQWDPEETFVEAIKKRALTYPGLEDALNEFWLSKH